MILLIISYVKILVGGYDNYFKVKSKTEEREESEEKGTRNCLEVRTARARSQGRWELPERRQGLGVWFL